MAPSPQPSPVDFTDLSAYTTYQTYCQWHLLRRRGLLLAEHTLLSHCVWKVGNGANLIAYATNWLHGCVPLYRDEIPLQLVARLKVRDLILPNQQGWDPMKIHTLFTRSDTHHILGLELPMHSNTPDQRIWAQHRPGQYTTKSGYYTLLLQQEKEIHSMTTTRKLRFYRTIWGLNIMPEWKLFLWKICHNSLATKEGLHRRNIGSSPRMSYMLSKF